MSFGSIQLGGLASGLDTAAIINAILSVEARPIQLLELQKATNEDRISLWGTLEGLVKTLRERAQDFTSATSSMFAHKVTVGDESIASFTVTGAPTTGSHTLLVNSLASADRYAFDGVADADADQGAGTISFDYDGESYSVDVAATDSNLNEIAAAINTAADGKVTASVINAGTDSAPSYQLVLAGEDTGADYAITNLTSSVAGVVNATNIAPASNAQIEIDGLAVERSTNVFNDVVEGISFTVQGTNVSATSFTAEVDVEGTQAKFQEFVDAYNAVMTFVNEQNTYDEEDGPGGNLFGDYGLNRVVDVIRSEMFDIIDIDDLGSMDGYSTLSVLGFDLATDGTLSIDETAFAAKMTADMDSFEAFFTDATDGIMVGLEEAVGYLVKGGTIDGRDFESFFDTKGDALGSLVKSLDERIEHLTYNLEKFEDRLVAQYAALEGLMSGLNSQLSYLAQGLAFPSFD